MASFIDNPASPGAGHRSEPPPQRLRRLVGGRRLERVWRNDLGGETYAVEGEGGGCEAYLKWNPAGAPLPSAEAESGRLRWAGRHLPVPEVVETGGDEAGSWLVTRPIAGVNAVTDAWRADPGHAVPGLGAGLRRWHDMMPVGDCPFTWSTRDRVAQVLSHQGDLDPRSRHREFQGLSTAEVIDRIRDVPAPDRIVVCHGDPCAPNFLLDAQGAVIGYLDVGALGVADRWADLAVASWSVEWNYGAQWQAAFFDAYGITADPDRIQYYRLLWDLG